jgi:Kdo2-lipid IVA lauroyltransferase/acyltransferase
MLKLRYRLEAFAMRTAKFLLPLLPWKVLRAVAWVLGTLVWLCDSRGRTTALANLKLAFPEKGNRDRRRWCRQCYQNFARYFAELFWSRRLNAANLNDYCFHTFSSPAARHAMETGAIVATPHAGNFEWLSVASGFWGYTCLIVAENFKNTALTGIFTDLRQTSGQVIIPQEGAVLRMFRHLKKGGRVALLTDLSAPPEQSATVIRCFGKQACVTMAHAALAHRTGRPIVPAISVPRPDGRYEIRFLEPIFVKSGETVQLATQATWDAFEPWIAADPAIWMWIYKHWRYLPTDETAEGYPPYAHRSKKFKRLQASL